MYVGAKSASINMIAGMTCAAVRAHPTLRAKDTICGSANAPIAAT